MSKELLVLDANALMNTGMSEETLRQSTVPLGMEGISADQLAMPRLQVSQGMSPQVMRNKPEYIEGLTVGQLFNTVTQEVYGSKIQVIPVKFSRSRLRWQKGTLDCQSKNGVDGGQHSSRCDTCEYQKWGSGKEGKGTDCLEYFNFLVMKSDDLSPMSISFKSASLSVARNWASNIFTRKTQLPTGEVRPAPAWFTVYEITVGEKPAAGGGTYYVPVVRVAGKASAAQISACSEFFNTFASHYVVEADGEQS